MGHANVRMEEYTEAHTIAAKELVWLPSKGGYIRAASATLENRVEATKVCTCF